MENYFNYFTEIEEHYQRRRGTGLLLSTLDWALIETWKQADIPVEAVLRGIDTAFDSHERRPSKSKKINSLAYCSQAVLTAAEDMKEAAVGAGRQQQSPGLEAEELAKFFLENASKLRKASITSQMQAITEECASSLETIAEGLKRVSAVRLEDLERHLTILEEKLLAALTMMTGEATLLNVRREADREIAPYRAKMPVVQIDQLIKQFVHKRLFEQAKIPRLSLFYM
ncbi:MAG TPA: hypothetical protein VHA33_03125 [Candidatus Angelobacter sp.]|nr:hypothetical protein [Candidatus Angelobacter sp.]